MNTIIGHTGFVGLNLCDQINFDHKFNSKNINEIKSIDHDIIFCCGISGNKYWVNNNGDEDKKNIDSLLNDLEKLKCNKFILISTIDIYTDSIYSSNRKYAESNLKKIFKEKLHIIRLPALFGDYLKKNIIFDLVNKKFFGKVNLENKLQWYYMSGLSSDIKYLLDNNIKELNLFTEPITIKELVDNYFEYDDAMYSDVDTALIYDFKTKNSDSGYWKNKDEILNDLKKWVRKF